MKALYILILLALLGGGYYLFTQEQDGSGTDTGNTAAEIDVSDTDNTAETADIRPNDDLLDAEEQTDADGDLEGSVGGDTDAAPVDDDEDSATRVIALDGFNYGYSQEEIRVAEGTEVTIELTSTDGFHDWVVDEFDAATERVRDGETTTVTFVADEPGTYEYYCSVGNHRALGMVGTIIVE